MAEPHRALADGRAADHHDHVWDTLWERSESLPAREFLSEILFEEIGRVVPALQGRRVLEAGSGSGRISARLADRGARLCLLDRSERALGLSRRFFSGRPGHFVRAEIWRLPFARGSFDLVFSSGVMEHWSQEEQRQVLRQIAGVVGEGGGFVAFNPYSRSVVYRVGKVILEGLRLWPYGHEAPVRTLSGAVGEEWELVSEHSLAFLAIPLNVFRLLPGLRRLDGVVQGMAVRILDRPFLGRTVRGLDRLLSRLLGGYLLVSVLRRTARPSEVAP